MSRHLDEAQRAAPGLAWAEAYRGAAAWVGGALVAVAIRHGGLAAYTVRRGDGSPRWTPAPSFSEAIRLACAVVGVEPDRACAWEPRGPRASGDCDGEEPPGADTTPPGERPVDRYLFRGGRARSDCAGPS